MKVVVPRGEDDSVAQFSNFKVFHDRKCKDCGRQWTPPCPPWGAYCCITAGLALLAVTVGLVWFLLTRPEQDQEMRSLAMTLCFLPGLPGVFALAYGIGTLLGVVGRLRIR